MQYMKATKQKLHVELLVVASLVMVFGFITHQRNFAWEDNVILWRDAVMKSPNKYRPRHNLGLAYSRTEQYDFALEEYGEALRVMPGSSKTHVNIGRVHEKMGHNE